MTRTPGEPSFCPAVEQLAALYDGALPEKKARPLREHLARCQKCCEDIRYLGRVLTAARKADSPPAPKKIPLSRPSRSPGGRPSRGAPGKNRLPSRPVKPA